MTIKHIVISGGGPPGIIAYGVYKELEKKGFWNIKDIKSIYGCSMGAVLSVFLILNYKWEWLDDYLMKRPWNKLVDIDPDDMFNIYNTCGIVDKQVIYNLLSPLLKGKNLSENITMLELYEFTKIDMHIFSTNMNSPLMEKIDISHKTYPNVPVYEAIYMSGTIPGLFKPMCDGENCYIDGGFMNNFPINDCIEDQNANEKEVLGVIVTSGRDNNITNISSLPNIYFGLMMKLTSFVNDAVMSGKEYKPNIIECYPENTSGLMDWWYILEDESKRCRLICQGEKAGLEFLKKINYKDESKN
jgi:predicted acylesterase/phospholipase RssA